MITWRTCADRAPVAALPRLGPTAFGPAAGVICAVALTPPPIHRVPHALPEMIALGGMARLTRVARQRANVLLENARLGRGF